MSIKRTKMIARIWTIGHSTRTIEAFISLLAENGTKLVADVRMFPGSKRYPQFNRENLARLLSEHAIRYEHFPELGGRRKAKPDSHNTAWRNESFRGYADYMETAGLAEASSAWSVWQAKLGRPRSCARKRSGGVAIAG
jgi:uncharacterized protein (DUF488 family)